MKNSSKFLLIVLGVIAALIIVLTVTVRVMISDYIVIRGDGEGFSFDDHDGTILSEEYDYSDFSRIKIEGGWDVEVVASENYEIKVDYREGAAEYLTVDKKGDTLYLGIRYEKRGELNDFHGATVRVLMPSLDSVRVEGAVNLNVADFQGGDVEFRLDGAGQIIGDNCSFKNLELESNGAVNVDLQDCDAVNADIDVDGAGNILLNMNGGELTGQISGFANLEYSGEVSRMSVSKDGLANIEYNE